MQTSSSVPADLTLPASSETSTREPPSPQIRAPQSLQGRELRTHIHPSAQSAAFLNLIPIFVALFRTIRLPRPPRSTLRSVRTAI